MNDESGNATRDGAGPEVSLADLRQEVRHLIADVGRPVRRVSLRAGDSVIEVEWETTDNAVEPIGPAPAVAVPETAVQSGALTDGTPGPHRVVAPLVGTFYGAPAPGAAPFVEAGDLVEVGQQVAIVEAMKLMNPVTADRAGKVISVEVKDGEMVEFAQTLFLIEPTDGPE